MTIPAATGPVHRRWRALIARTFCRIVVRVLFRLRIEGRERFAAAPAIYCFNHLNWTDPIVLMATLPGRPRYALFGPREEDMTRGPRNRLIAWTGMCIPYRPGRRDLVETTRRVTRTLEAGWVVGIAGEGRIHRGERELLPLADGPAFFAIRAGVPVIPLAINGTSWLGFRRTIRVRVGEPILPGRRRGGEAAAELTRRMSEALRALVSDFPDPPEPGPFGRWLTEAFNDWPEGARPALGEGDAAAGDRARAEGDGAA